jgi:hypothetical protein
MQTSFMDGGYYKYDLPGTMLSVISLNTNYWSIKNHHYREAGSQAFKMQDWLEQKLQENANLPETKRRQVILFMHVFPGLNYYPKQWLPNRNPI